MVIYGPQPIVIFTVLIEYPRKIVYTIGSSYENKLKLYRLL